MDLGHCDWKFLMIPDATNKQPWVLSETRSTPTAVRAFLRVLITHLDCCLVGSWVHFQFKTCGYYIYIYIHIYLFQILIHFGGIYGKHLSHRLIFAEVLGFFSTSRDKELFQGIILGSVLTSVLKHVACTGQPGVAGGPEGSPVWVEPMPRPRSFCFSSPDVMSWYELWILADRIW